MKYEEFKSYVKENIKDYLSDEYADCEVEYQHIVKSGYEYDGLMVREKGKVSIAPALNVTEAFKNYENGDDLEEIMERLADCRMTATMGNFDKNDILVYEKAKARLYPRLINTSCNGVYIADKPHREIEDLSVVYAVRIFEDNHGFGDAVVTDDLAKVWGVSEAELYDTAVRNLGKTEPLFQNLEEALFGIMSGADDKESSKIEDINIEDYSAPFFVLTNKQKTKGASMVLNVDVMKRISEKLGGFYILPSSVDEVLIIPKGAADRGVDELKNLVEMVNCNEVRPEDQLSNNVYEYDVDKGTIVIA